MTQIAKSFPMTGGLDLASPAMSTAPGKAIGGFNYECDVKGYRRITGFERLDGRPAPSNAVYWVLSFTAGLAAISAGDGITGETSGAVAIALDDGVITSGATGSSDAAGYVPIAILSGSFTADEDVAVSASTVATMSGVPVQGDAPSDAQATAWLLLERARRRAAITAVPGEGPVRGIHSFAGSNYAFRNAVGAGSGAMFKATSGGWSEMNLGRSVAFSAGSAAFSEGDTLSQGGVTATVERIIVTDGTWGAGDAIGFLTLSGVSGGAFSAGAATSAGGTASLGGADIANVLPAGGTYEIVNHNFFGAASLLRMYGANGVGRAFEWDGTVFSFIPCPVPVGVDTPRHIAEFRQHLFLSFDAGSWLHSGIGQPLDFRVALGAGEIAVGSEPVGAVNAASSLTMFSADRVDYLAGTSAADFTLNVISSDSGAVRHTLQMINVPIYMDTAAIRKLSATQNLGGWRMSGLSPSVEKLIQDKKARGVTQVASMRVRGLDLYRAFYSDGTAISLYVGRKYPEIMPLDLPITCHCAFSGTGPDGGEITMIGGEDGMAYQFDRGDDFDGDTLTALLRLSFYAAGNPRLNKRWHTAHIEVEGGITSTLRATAEYDYGDPRRSPSAIQSFTVSGGGGFWNTAFWNDFFWSSQLIGTANVTLQGIGKTISLAIITEETAQPPHTISVVTLDYSNRGMIKGDG
ncbi:MAG: hypothetical protein ACJA1L_001545 [Paracoccaceae bacterium]|jgi:hypothetical protein